MLPSWRPGAVRQRKIKRAPEGVAEVTIVGKDNVFEPETVEIKIDQEGTYTMQCTYHPEMKGELKATR